MRKLNFLPIRRFCRDLGIQVGEGFGQILKYPNIYTSHIGEYCWSCHEYEIHVKLIKTKKTLPHEVHRKYVKEARNKLFQTNFLRRR